MENELNDCYQELFKTVVDLQMKYSSQMVAANMLVQALRIYKTTLDDEGFRCMMETITESESKIESFTKPTIN